jgi:hypothetical protein
MHSAKSEKHSAKWQRELDEHYIGNGFFAEYFLSDTRQRLCRVSLVLGKEKSLSRRLVMETSPLPSILGETRQRGHQRGPLSDSLSSALEGTRQSLLLCRVSGSQHSAKTLYRCPGVPSLSSVMTLTLGKVPSIHLFYLFFLFHPNKQNISHIHNIYHIYITYLTNTINQTSSHIITNMFRHKHKYPTLKNINLKYLTKHYQHLTSSDQVISQSMNNTKKGNISSSV